jgi:hypothetical protein
MRPKLAPDSFARESALADVSAAPPSRQVEPEWFSNFQINGPTGPSVKLRNEAPRPLFADQESKTSRREASTIVPIDYTLNPAAEEPVQTAIAIAAASPLAEVTAKPPLVMPNWPAGISTIHSAQMKSIISIAMCLRIPSCCQSEPNS